MFTSLYIPPSKVRSIKNEQRLSRPTKEVVKALRTRPMKKKTTLQNKSWADFLDTISKKITTVSHVLGKRELMTAVDHAATKQIVDFVMNRETPTDLAG